MPREHNETDREAIEKALIPEDTTPNKQAMARRIIEDYCESGELPDTVNPKHLRSRNKAEEDE